MAVVSPTPGKAPWHLWVVGVVSLLWNAVGALDFAMTQTRNEAYLQGFTPEQLAYFFGFPLWVVLAWGLGTWGSLAGSVLLLMRRKWAWHVFAASFVGMILTFTHNYVLSDGTKVMGDHATSAKVLSTVIMVVGLMLLFYTRAQRQRGVLR